MIAILAGLAPERASSQAAREVKGLKGTSLGGERPKLTVLHKGQYWIAKLQDRGDPPHAPLREYLAMRLARRCGVRAAEVEFVAVADREMLLVKRFDRHVDPRGQVWRNLYASAHTVLRLDSQAPGERQRSYVALAHEVQRWCGLADVNAAELKPITRAGSSLATRANLLATCGNFAYEPGEAQEYIEQTLSTVATGWGAEQLACGFAPDTLAAPGFGWLAG